MTTILIITSAILPAAILFYYINYLDRNRPEPTSELMKGFGLGIASALVSLVINLIMQMLGFKAFGELFTYLAPPGIDGLFACVQMAFVEAAIPEECAKLLMLWLLLRSNRSFDERFDGIVYAVSIGMGFAATENVMYLFSNYDNWMAVGAMRAIVSVPGHFAFAVLMGYYYSMTKFEHRNTQRDRAMVLVAPIVAHGVFDFLLMMMDLNVYLAVFLAIVFIVFFVYLMIRVKNHIADMLERDRQALATPPPFPPPLPPNV